MGHLSGRKGRKLMILLSSLYCGTVVSGSNSWKVANFEKVL